MRELGREREAQASDIPTISAEAPASVQLHEWGHDTPAQELPLQLME